MKTKLGAAAAVAVLLMLLLLALGRPRTDAPTAENSAPAAAPGAAVPAPPPFKAADVAAMTMTHAALPEPVSFEKTAKGWIAQGLNAPLDNEKIESLLRILLESGREPAGDVSAAAAGLEDGDGVRIALESARGREYALTIGLHPAGRRDATYVRDASGAATLLLGDARAGLGLWKNLPDSPPDAAYLLERRVLRFDPAEAVKITASYPDHSISFVRAEDGTWRNERQSPGGDWSREGLRDWLADLAAFQVSGLADDREADAARPVPTHRISISLADGGEKTLQAVPNHVGEGCIAWVSDYHDIAFQLPEWRFGKYFNRLSTLFPHAAPNFDMNDIRVVDVRRNGENIKILRQDGVWRTVALPYPLRQERMERLARLLAGWRPVDYADADGKNTRAAYGGPMIEIVLSGGGVHQYRLGGRHPLFPWRYITLDGDRILSVTDAEAAAMFPGFADLLYLGPVFKPVEGMILSRMLLEDADGKMLVELTRAENGVWTASSGKDAIELGEDEGDRLARELSVWPVVGLSPGGVAQTDAAYRLEAFWGTESSAITLYQPIERDIPYRTGDGDFFLLDRADFSNWLAAVKIILARIEEKAAAPDAETAGNAEPAGSDDASSLPEAGETPEPETPDVSEPAQSETAAPTQEENADKPGPETQPEADGEDDADGDDAMPKAEPEEAEAAAVEADAGDVSPDDPARPMLDVSDRVVDIEPGSEDVPEAGLVEPRRIVPGAVEYYGRVGGLVH